MITMFVIVLLPGAIIAWSYLRTGRCTRYKAVFYPADRWSRPGTPVSRRYRSWRHMLYRLWDTLGYAFPLARVYLCRTLSPAFREKIMIVTAMANNCPY